MNSGRGEARAIAQQTDIANLGSSPNILYGPPNLPRVTPECCWVGPKN